MRRSTTNKKTNFVCHPSGIIIDCRKTLCFGPALPATKESLMFIYISLILDRGRRASNKHETKHYPTRDGAPNSTKTNKPTFVCHPSGILIDCTKTIIIPNELLFDETLSHNNTKLNLPGTNLVHHRKSMQIYPCKQHPKEWKLAMVRKLSFVAWDIWTYKIGFKFTFKLTHTHVFREPILLHTMQEI